jgi:SAM-dependent methyltransferase
MNHTEIARGERFPFGKNWSKFVKTLSQKTIDASERALSSMLGDIRGKSFLDVGCGSGLSSLAACRLGADVRSFDYDPQCVACALELRRRYGGSWPAEEGSALDTAYLKGLGTFDIVYSWGVLHHTGKMWSALDNMCMLVKPGGVLLVAIYNDMGRRSRAWKFVKAIYNRTPRGMKWVVLLPSAIYLHGPAFIRDLLIGKPLATWRGDYRGMSAWVDVIDWVGGYPYEVARPEQIFHFYKERGFVLEYLTTSPGLGCNEFVFRRSSSLENR